MSRHLLEPITDGGIRNANFFNGRLLTAQDLDAMQESNRDQHRQLGAGLGDGVVYGLEVELASSSTQARPVLGVSGGLAFNRRGEAVALSMPNVEVELTREAETFAPEAGLFGECSPVAAGDDLSNVGVYILVASPASAFEGFAPARHSISSDAVDRCGRRYAVEGIKFRRERVDLSTLGGLSTATRTLIASLLQQTGAASLSKLRNVLAHLCFDTEEPTGQRRDPFKRVTEDAGHVNYGALAALRKLGQLTDCDVPLALVYWSREGVQFVDNWAVRRLARRYLELDVLSVLRGYGYERLLQFQRHLEELFGSLGGLAAVLMKDYFVFVPPVGYFPVTGAKSPRGFHPTNFFKQFTTGVTGQLTTEKFGALLLESYACPDVDLQPNPSFQVYSVRENTAAVAAGAAPQLYQVFVSRALNGPLAWDGVAKAFYDAWEAYRGLIKRRVFLPPGSDEARVAAQVSITSAIRDVLEMSNRQYALAASGSLDAALALEAFHEVYRVQDELSRYFQSSIPGIVETQDRETFGQQLGVLLNTAIPGGRPGLRPAFESKSLPAAVAAQNAINLFVGGWSGEGVAVGPFGASWQSSPKGQSVVPGGTDPFPQLFTVTNRTDKSLDIQLEAAVTAPQGDWSQSTTIEDANGAEITSVSLAPGTDATVTVQVKAPADAHIGDDAALTLTTSIGPPNNRSSEAHLTLHVASSGGGAVTSSIAFDGAAQLPAGDTDNANPNQTFTYKFNLLYTAPPGTTAPAQFRFIVNLTSDTAAEWLVKIFDLSAATTNPSPGVFMRELPLTPSVAQQVQVVVKAPSVRGAQDKTATFTVRVESASLQPQVFVEHPQTFSIRLRHA
ncbi:MAG: hypothetical protein M3348_14230 [Acidobacteriota bacterium]|nr:hypothetical protein [Acidobacteriota bacterium]